MVSRLANGPWRSERRRKLASIPAIGLGLVMLVLALFVLAHAERETGPYVWLALVDGVLWLALGLLVLRGSVPGMKGGSQVG
jgi:hypothetical protein